MIVLLAAAIVSTPALGTAEARCRPGEPGPAVVVTVVGLKDRVGKLRAELYPPRDGDFMADDNKLVAAGKVFRRSVIATPTTGSAQLCLRVPAPGRYALLVVHARDGGHGFSLLRDGIGFGNNPRLGLGKPRAALATLTVGAGVTNMSVVMNYRSGLFSFAPLKR